MGSIRIFCVIFLCYVVYELGVSLRNFKGLLWLIWILDWPINFLIPFTLFLLIVHLYQWSSLSYGMSKRDMFTGVFYFFECVGQVLKGLVWQKVVDLSRARAGEVNQGNVSVRSSSLSMISACYKYLIFNKIIIFLLQRGPEFWLW